MPKKLRPAPHEVDRELYCDECPDIEFDSENELREHMIEVHNYQLPPHRK